MSDILGNRDKKILQLLQSDASISIERLADIVSLSRNACWRRMKLLEEKGYISKRVVLLNAEKIGLALTVFVLIKTNSHNSDWLDKFKSAVHSMPQIVGAYRMAGDIDYMLKVKVATVKDYDEFYQRLIEKVEITNVSASFVMEEIQDTTVLPV